MRWPWSKRETRDSSFTDSLIAQIVSQASSGTLARPSGTGALEASASIIARCFAAAVVSGPDHFVAALGPSTLSLIGRSLIRQGEILFAIEVRDGGRVMLTPAASWDVEGDHDPASWSYRLVLGGPSRLTTLSPVPSEGMIHVRLQADPQQPWRGVAPLASAALAGRLSAETVMALADEASGPRGTAVADPSRWRRSEGRDLEGRYSSVGAVKLRSWKALLADGPPTGCNSGPKATGKQDDSARHQARR